MKEDRSRHKGICIKITIEELRCMKGREGLILQGCGGSPGEWVEGINDMLTESGILLAGTSFQAEDCRVFEHHGRTCLLFPFSDAVKVDLGKLAIWRIKTHGTFGGTWLSDYVSNDLGGFTDETAGTEEGNGRTVKPDCALIGQDGNIFHLMGIASRTLKKNGMADRAEEMCDRICASGSYGQALQILGDYVTITSADESDEEEEVDLWM